MSVIPIEDLNWTLTSYKGLFDTGWYAWNPFVIGMTLNQVTSIHDETRVAGNVYDGMWGYDD